MIPIQKEVRGPGALAQRRNVPGNASYTGLGDLTHLLGWRFINPWVIYVTQGLLRYINHHLATDVNGKHTHNKQTDFWAGLNPVYL